MMDKVTDEEIIERVRGWFGDIAICEIGKNNSGSEEVRLSIDLRSTLFLGDRNREMKLTELDGLCEATIDAVLAPGRWYPRTAEERAGAGSFRQRVKRARDELDRLLKGLGGE